MAGDWLKFEKSTPEKPEVFAIAARISLPSDTVVGKLFRVWAWFDTHTLDGNARGVTPAQLDDVAGVTGFIAAMAAVGWMLVDNDGVSLPNFERHNGETAKQRALTGKRVAKSRGKGNAKSNGDTVTPPLAREEKRREESPPCKEVHTGPGTEPDERNVGVFEGQQPKERAKPTPYGLAAIALTKVGLRVTSQNPDLIAAIDEGVTAEHLVELATTYPGKPVLYLITAARGERAKQATEISADSQIAGTAALSRQAQAIQHVLRGSSTHTEGARDDS